MSKITNLIKISAATLILGASLTACAPVATGEQWVPAHTNRNGLWVQGHYMPGAVGPITGGPMVPGHYNRWGGWVPAHAV